MKKEDKKKKTMKRSIIRAILQKIKIAQNTKTIKPLDKKGLNKARDVCFMDTETGGFNTGYIWVDGKLILMDGFEKCSIIELAGMSFHKKGYQGFYSDICKPLVRVGAGAASTHGYTNKVLEEAIDFEKTPATKAFLKDVKSGKIIVAHNMPFDEKMFNIHGVMLDQDAIADTLKVARHCYNDGLIGLEGTYYEDLKGTKPDNHTLQYFRYLFEMDDQDYFKEAMKMAGLTEVKPHTALSDVFILWLFTAKLMNDFDLTLEDMVALTKTPVLENKITYGAKLKKLDQTYQHVIYKESVTPWGDPQPGYKDIMWVWETGPMGVDTEYSLIYHFSKAMLAGRVPFIKDKKYDYREFLYLGMKYVFDKEELDEALAILGKDQSYLEFLLENMEEKLEASMKKGMPKDIDILDQDKFLSKRLNRELLHNYYDLFRKDYLEAYIKGEL